MIKNCSFIALFNCINLFYCVKTIILLKPQNQEFTDDKQVTFNTHRAVPLVR